MQLETLGGSRREAARSLVPLAEKRRRLQPGGWDISQLLLKAEIQLDQPSDGGVSVYSS